MECYETNPRLALPKPYVSIHQKQQTGSSPQQGRPTVLCGPMRWGLVCTAQISRESLVIRPRCPLWGEVQCQVTGLVTREVGINIQGHQGLVVVRSRVSLGSLMETDRNIATFGRQVRTYENFLQSSECQKNA